MSEEDFTYLGYEEIYDDEVRAVWHTKPGGRLIVSKGRTSDGRKFATIMVLADELLNDSAIDKDVLIKRFTHPPETA